MNGYKRYTSMVPAIIICVCYLFITTFHYHIDKSFPQFPINIITLILFLIIIIILIRGIIIIIRQQEYPSLKQLRPIIILGLTFLYTCFSPYKFSSEMLESKAILTAYFKGTQNQAYIRFRADKSFELNWTGIFGYDEWFEGTYIENGDKLFLNYKASKPARFGSVVFKDGSNLISIDKPGDSTIRYVPFYIFPEKG